MHALSGLKAESPRSAGGNTDGWHAEGMIRGGTAQTTGLDHTHAIRANPDPASNVPPSTRVMFICKM